MKRYDLRELKTEFMPRLVEIMEKEISDGENGIFLFEIGDFSPIQATADLVKEHKWTLMNSLKFNEVDWTIVVKKEQSPVETVESEETEENK
ncbi:MAG: NADH-ubiquinone oxidoreductase subunit E family protein [Campylobacterota bacterium]|nr:NADH-ubiquinone oxidoreductase subunit E family protein [Campylobacterota bacterium]